MPFIFLFAKKERAKLSGSVCFKLFFYSTSKFINWAFCGNKIYQKIIHPSVAPCDTYQPTDLQVRESIDREFFLGFWNLRNKEETAKNTVVLQSRTNDFVFLIESYTETNHLYLSLYIYFQYLSRVDRRRPCRQCKLNQRLDATNFVRQKPQAKIVFRYYVFVCMCLCLCERVFFPSRFSCSSLTIRFLSRILWVFCEFSTSLWNTNRDFSGWLISNILQHSHNSIEYDIIGVLL